jgi:hypothetical protein
VRGAVTAPFCVDSVADTDIHDQGDAHATTTAREKLLVVRG